ncbi:MAG: hypothetical protein JO044_19770 [Mycobacteriaceae bacterium]|nr:hypothetical protein [Mycobacteriaceae bacterium]MBV9638461.1 hypothetical protein [Mycobacteriaceae bacterium]
MKMAPDTGEPRRDRRTFAGAARFTAIVVAIALVVLLAALLWLNDCKTGSASGQVSLARCNAIQRNTLALGPAVILAVGGVMAFVRTYRVWRARGGWWIWQGAGWFLMLLMLVVLTMTVPVALMSP